MINNILTHKSFILFLSLSFVLFIAHSCKQKTEPKTSRLKEIKQAGEIVAVTDYNSTNYFIYRGKPMGYQYDLLKRYAKHLGVELKINVNKNLQESFDLLQRGECDILAYNLTITEDG